MSQVFISYSRKDKVYTDKLYQSLLKFGIDAWIDWDGIDPGLRWESEIKKHAEGCSAFILVMSPNSRESEWVKKELAIALQYKKYIVPLLLEGDVWSEIAHLQYADVKNSQTLPTRFLTILKQKAPLQNKWLKRIAIAIMSLILVCTLTIITIIFSTTLIPSITGTPTTTLTSTTTPTHLNTFTPTVTATATITLTSTITHTLTTTFTPTPTFTPTVSETPTFTFTPSLTPRPSKTPTLECPIAQRLRIGEQAVVVASPQVKIKKSPGLSTELENVLRTDRRADVIDGPVCVDNIWWWKIYYVGIQRPDIEGWAGEGDIANGYWLAPVH